MTNTKLANLNNNHVQAKSCALRTSPRKLNIVASSIRGLDVAEALNSLTFCKRRIALAVKKTLLSAISNAENNNNLDIDNLFVHEIYVGKGKVMKRMRPRARGRSARILKPFSNLYITVSEKKRKD